jgi:hypothetical protein
MFVGGIPEAAASASMLKRAGYSAAATFALWSGDRRRRGACPGRARDDSGIDP